MRIILSKPFLVLAGFAFLAACGGETSQTLEDTTTPSTTEDVVEKVADTTRKVSKETGDKVIATGTFEGRSDHVVTGGVSLVRTADGFQLILEEDFSLDGAPDPTVAFGNGQYVDASNFSKLNQNTGRQVYTIPATLDPNLYSQVYIWCKQFSVPLGVANLELADLSEALDDTYGS